VEQRLGQRDQDPSGAKRWLQVSGTIDGVRNKDNVGFASQADSDAWSMDVKATYPERRDGHDHGLLHPAAGGGDPATGALAGSLSGAVSKTKKTLSNDESTLVFAAGSVATDTTRHHRPARRGERAGARRGDDQRHQGTAARLSYYLPHGAKFLQNVSLAMPYDKALIPPGHTRTTSGRLNDTVCGIGTSPWRVIMLGEVLVVELTSLLVSRHRGQLHPAARTGTVEVEGS